MNITNKKQLAIAVLAIVSILLHLLLRGFVATRIWAPVPLYVALALGGTPLVWDLLRKFFRREFGSDLLAGISIVTSLVLGEYLAGTLVVLMLSGGEALEEYAVSSASSVLAALSRRMPTLAHRKVGTAIEEISLEAIAVGDLIVVLPHEVCPIDGTVTEGRSVMDESYLTGEPYLMSKTPGSSVLSGSINGESALTIRADKLASDSRYNQIMRVMQSSQQRRPQIRRLGDQLGALYTPLAIGLAVAAWFFSGDPVRFLAVLVVATPCPLLIAIPVAIIGSISLAAKRAIIIRDPAVLEQIDRCRTFIFDKTGTLTYGKPRLTEQCCAEGVDATKLLAAVASLEQYSKHPLAEAVLRAAQQAGVELEEVSEVSENPGEGMRGLVAGRQFHILSRKLLPQFAPEAVQALPEESGGLECVVLEDGRYAATYRFRDAPRQEGAPFIQHLSQSHSVQKVMLVSGDRESEVQYLADLVGVSEVFASQSPEQKLEIVRRETGAFPTLFVGDGINDAPALMAATVGIAFGQNSDVTSEAAGAVVMDSSLSKVDELMHIGRRMRRIALQSAVGGMAVSVIAMLVAAAGYLDPVSGAITQEVIDVVAVLNSLRVALSPRSLTDF